METNHATWEKVSKDQPEEPVQADPGERTPHGKRLIPQKSEPILWPPGVLKAVEHINKTLGPALLEKASRGTSSPFPSSLRPCASPQVAPLPIFSPVLHPVRDWLLKNRTSASSRN